MEARIIAGTEINFISIHSLITFLIDFGNRNTLKKSSCHVVTLVSKLRRLPQRYMVSFAFRKVGLRTEQVIVSVIILQL